MTEAADEEVISTTVELAILVDFRVTLEVLLDATTEEEEETARRPSLLVTGIF